MKLKINIDFIYYFFSFRALLILSLHKSFYPLVLVHYSFLLTEKKPLKNSISNHIKNSMYILCIHIYEGKEET